MKVKELTGTLSQNSFARNTFQIVSDGDQRHFLIDEVRTYRTKLADEQIAEI